MATTVRAAAERPIDPAPSALPPSPTTALTLLAPLATAALPSHTTLIGYSAGGRALLARRFGSSDRLLLIVGGIHGGWEANTVELVNLLIDHFAAHPEEIPPSVALALVPVANPDGLSFMREAEGRFNANGVDLNRNWGCGWQPEAVWRDAAVSPGAQPFSEPETAALADFIRAQRPSAALFYHSAAAGVFSGSCAETPLGAAGTAASSALAAVYGEAAGYSFGRSFSAYPVTGTAASWAAGQGIAAADIELQSWNDPEFERNLRALRAVIAWMSQN